MSHSSTFPLSVRVNYNPTSTTSPHCAQKSTAAQDGTVTISSSKAKELGVSNGDIVFLVGRRRKASFGRVKVTTKGKKCTCQISANLAANLRLRQDDKVKIVAMHDEEDIGERSGDLMLLKHRKAPVVQSVTLSPLEDSLKQLEASEGGDELSEDEIMERFVRPYTEDCDGAVVKKGHTLALRDDNNKKLEFIVTHVGLDGDSDEAEGEGECSVCAPSSSIQQ
jgi:hypothetical protein